jgi:hypothetical protein
MISFQKIGIQLSTAGTVVYNWRAGVYGNTTSWPTCGCYHEGRLWLAGAVSNRWDASASNALATFSPTNPDGSVSDNNAISFIANSDGVNTTFWMQSDAIGIIVGTENGEWLIQSTTQGLAITPSNIQAHRVTKAKCAAVEPARTEHTLAVVQRQLRKVCEYFSDVYSGKFTAPNITERARHLTAGLIAEIRYQQEVTPTLWMRDQAGNLFGCTYKRDTLMTSQGPTFYGWHRHKLGSGRSVKSIAVGPSQNGTLDALVMTSTDGTYYYVEVLADLFEETTNYQNAWLLDSAIKPTSYVVGNTGVTFNGLWPLNGRTVQCVAGGLDCGMQDNWPAPAGLISDFVVSNGSIFVPRHASRVRSVPSRGHRRSRRVGARDGDGVAGGSGNGQFTKAFVQSFGANQMPAVIGFTYTSQAQTLRPVSPAESGARAGPALAKLRRSHKYAIQAIQTNGIQIGASFVNMDYIPFESRGGAASYVLPALFTGIYQGDLGDLDDYGFEGTLALQVTRPVPCIIPALGAFVETQDV